MRKIVVLCSWMFFAVICLAPSSCRRQQIQQPYQPTWSSEATSSDQSEQYVEAEALFKEKKYDDVIRILSGPASAEPTNLKLNVLLAKAQVEKCAILKETGNMSYKVLIHQPYETAGRLHKLQPHPELYYIVAKSLLINNRYSRAKRTINKALYYSPNNPDYLLVLGDVYLGLSKFRKDDPYYEKRLLTKAKAAYERAVEIKNEVKGYVDLKIQQISEKLK